MVDVHTLSGAYAVHGLADDERAEFEQHLAVCPACRDEVAGLQEAAASLAETGATAPPASLRASVLDDIATVRPLPPLEPVPTESTSDAHGMGTVVPIGAHAARRRSLPTLLAAAAAVILVAIVSTVTWRSANDDDATAPTADLTATERVLQAPDAQRVAQPIDGGGKVTVVYSEDADAAVLVTEDMRRPPEGHVMEAWYQVPGQGMVKAALLPTDEGDAAVLLKGDASDAVAVGITVEPEGGSETPTTPPFAVMEIGEA